MVRLLGAFSAASFAAADLPVFTIHGDDWRSLGAQAGGRIRSFFQTSPTKAALEELLRDPSMAAAFEGLWESHRARFPSLARELEETAAGAGLPARDLALYSFKNELIALNESSSIDECSDVHVHTHDAALLGHNEDGEAALLDTAYWIETDSFQALAYPGLLPGGAFGFNRHGLVLSVNALSPRRVALQENCVGKYWLARQLLDARSLDEAETLLRTSCHTFGFSSNLGSVTTGELVNVEIGPGASASLRRTSGSFFHANAYLHLNVTESPSLSPSSAHRLRRAQELFPASSSRDVRRILGDTADATWPVYRTGSEVDDSVTIATGLYDLSAKRLQVWAGVNPLSGAPLFERGLRNATVDTGVILEWV